MGKTLPSETPKYIVDLPPPPPKEYKFHCHCGKQFTKQSRLKMHEVTHSSEKPYKCSLQGCEASYYRKNHLKRHEVTRHAKVDGDYRCTFDGCVATFDSSLSLYFHCKRRHREKKYSCSSCLEMFSKKFQLKEHEHSHTGVPSFSCGTKGCSEVFVTHAMLKSHQKHHRRQRVVSSDSLVEMKNGYHCGECQEVFDKWSNYLGHRKTMHISTKCSVCKKTLLKTQLRQHLKIHKDCTETFACPHEACSRSYQHSRNLAQHLRQYHQGLGYACDVCSKNLSTKQKLEHHKNIFHNPTNAPRVVSRPVIPERALRDRILDMLDGEVNFDINRPGPAKGSKINQRLDATESEDMEFESATYQASFILAQPQPCQIEENEITPEEVAHLCTPSEDITELTPCTFGH